MSGIGDDGDAVLAMIDDAIARVWADTIDLPHIVYIIDTEVDVVSAFGPYLTPIEACAAAERLKRELTSPDGDANSVITQVVALEQEHHLPGFASGRGGLNGD